MTLLPDLDTTMARDGGRDAAMRERARALHAQLTAEVAASRIPGAILDTSAHTDPRESGDAVQDAIGRGLALFVEPRE